MTERRPGRWQSIKTWLNERREPIKTWLEVLRDILAIAALFVGAYWTYTLFGWKERPSLKPRAGFSHSLSWEKLSSSSDCRAAHYVSIQNNGMTTFDVTRVEVKGWKFDIADMPRRGDFGAYLDLNKLPQDKPDFTQEFKEASDPFIQSYPPGGAFGHSFEWTMSREQELKKKNKWVFIRVAFHARSEHGDANWHVGDWDEVCVPRAYIKSGETQVAAPPPQQQPQQ